MTEKYSLSPLAAYLLDIGADAAMDVFEATAGGLVKEGTSEEERIDHAKDTLKNLASASLIEFYVIEPDTESLASASAEQIAACFDDPAMWRPPGAVHQPQRLFFKTTHKGMRARWA